MHSNNTTVQNAKKRPSQPKRLRSRRKGLKPEKEGFFAPHISYNLHYTKYYKNQKQRPPFSCVPSSVQVLGASAVLLYHFVWDVWIACQAGIIKYSWTRPLSCERPLHQTLQRCIQRLCSEVRADRFIVNARHCLTAFFAAKLCNVLFAGHKALFCQNRRTVYILQ